MNDFIDSILFFLLTREKSFAAPSQKLDQVDHYLVIELMLWLYRESCECNLEPFCARRRKLFNDLMMLLACQPNDDESSWRCEAGLDGDKN